ncbi:MAG: insulinase family protein [Alphaproteobacteria bacterium]|nr:insulinase family protein [Alphaproteobacteria bacterium]
MKRRLLAFIFLLTLLLPCPLKAAVFYPQTKTLDNELQIVVVENHLSPAAAFMLFYKVGAADDPKGQTGLAHFLEHMMFKGTRDVPKGAFSAKIAALGGQENAYTTKDYTAYHTSLAAERLEDIFALEADRMKNLLLDPQETLRERDVVLNERKERTDNSPQGIFAEKMNEALYGAHPYAAPIIGKKQDIQNFTPQIVRDFYERHYAPSRAILVVSGAVQPQEIFALAQKYFGEISAPSFAAAPLPVWTREKGTIAVEHKDERVKQAFFVRRWVLPEIKVQSREALAFDVLAELLAGGEVGLAFRHFVLDQNSATSLSASADTLTRGPVSFVLSATPAPDHDVRDLERDVMRFLQELAQKGLTARTVVEAKQRMKDSAIFARDRLMAPAQILGATLAAGYDLSFIEDWPEHIDTVTTKDVHQALQTLLHAPYQARGILEGGA